MARQYIFASHGTFAEGLLNSAELILGKQDNVHTLCAYVHENVDLQQQISALLAQFSPQDELVVITDIFAGSVNNAFMHYLARPGFHLIAGLNLPLVIELLISGEQQDTAQLITEALVNLRETIQYCNDTLKGSAQTDTDF